VGLEGLWVVGWLMSLAGAFPVCAYVRVLKHSLTAPAAHHMEAST
jgi:hypothetical protein